MVSTFLKDLTKDLTGWHRQGSLGNIFLFTTARSGSSWIAESIARQPRMKYVNEPFDLRREAVARRLGTRAWEDLYDDGARSRIEAYIDFFVAGRRGSNFCSPSLGSEFHDPVTDRIVFKILHACEQDIEWLRRRYSAEVILLLRHPLAVSLSREETPRLGTFLESDYARHFSRRELERAHDIVARGNPLHVKVLDWCLQNAVPLRGARPEWITLTYEELVEYPATVIGYLAKRLSLRQMSHLGEHFSKPSATLYKSDARTRERLSGTQLTAERRWLLWKWKEKLSDDEERSAMEIVEFFGIDLYRYGSVMPSEDVVAADDAPPPAASAARDLAESAERG